jgi:ribosome-associated heat shock protein Hsp15
LEPAPAIDTQRIDKWLWHARVVRTRTDAAKLVVAGYARVNGQRIVAASHVLHAGDVVTLALDRSVRVLEVVAFSPRRGPPTAGAALYRSLT